MSEASRLVVQLLREPASARSLAGSDWTAVLTAGRAESLLGSLAFRLSGESLPAMVAGILESVRSDAEQGKVQALWEAEMARRALAPLDVPVILLKGTAFAAADLPASEGRSIGDLDLLVPREALEAVQQALLEAGWEWVKEDPYDDLYYRRWMHELPPLIHEERDRMVDVHHTILPLTAKRRPDAEALVSASVPLKDGLRVLAPADMIVHAAAHLFADGDLAGGLRNLWDIDRLVRHFAAKDGTFWSQLSERSALHQMKGPVRRALRLAAALYFTPIDRDFAGRRIATDPLFEARLLARDGWGRRTRPLLRTGFYIRSHWLRMPPLMLARHLGTKAMRQRRERAGMSSR